MDRWSSWTLSVLLLATVAIVVLAARAPREAVVATSGTATASGAPVSSAEPAAARDEPDRGPGAMPSAVASATPALPPDAPPAVRIGVIQFSYRGAELAGATAPTREIARERARQALEVARQDFAKAVPLGDAASGADLGTIPRGVLEPSVEYAVFTLAPGEVAAEPLDTPRGFWVVRRLR